MRFEHMFKVRGQAAFPIDMLRYDRCWPGTREDSGKVARSLRQEHHDTTDINLMSVTMDPNWRPAVDRWRMCGWSVHEHTRIVTDVHT
jgi:hypothetical protein